MRHNPATRPTAGATAGRPERRRGADESGFCLLPVLFVVLVTAAIVAYYLYTRVPVGQGGASTVAADTPSAAPAAPDAAHSSMPPGLVTARGPLRPVPPASTPGDAGGEVRSALAVGDYERAVELLRAEHGRSGAPRARRLLVSSLNSLAVNRFNSGRAAQARDLLVEAAGLIGSPVDDRERGVFVNLATVSLSTGDLDAADAALGLAGPGDRTDRLKKAIYIERARADYEKGDLGSALAHYERALSLDPGDARLKADVERLRSKADQNRGMTTKRGRHFTIRYEGGENAVAGHLIGLLLEEAYFKVGRDLGYYPDDAVKALLYSAERFRDTTRSPSWAGAIYDGAIKVPAGGLTEKTSALERVIFHEYTHALVHRLSRGRAPMWLNEGLAQYEEGPNYSNPRGLAGVKGVSLRALEGSFTGYGSQDAQRAYAVSLSATSYIIDRYGISAVKRILVDLGRGASLEGAIRSALYISYDELERGWSGSLGR
ncbi:MAG: peptidase MA family metallohydrolase [Thermodesulfobacteriota bacterium]